MFVRLSLSEVQIPRSSETGTRDRSRVYRSNRFVLQFDIGGRAAPYNTGKVIGKPKGFGKNGQNPSMNAFGQPPTPGKEPGAAGTVMTEEERQQAHEQIIARVEQMVAEAEEKGAQIHLQKIQSDAIVRQWKKGSIKKIIRRQSDRT